ncbi:MAG: nitrous oxide-stimulated promoter family protein [bacterium]
MASVFDKATVVDALQREEARRQDLPRDVRKDLRILAVMTELYCASLHREREKTPFSLKGVRGSLFSRRGELLLCDDCHKLLSHGVVMRLRCPYEPKPACKRCPTNCYRPGYREQMREMMRFSGKQMILRGRLDLLLHYLF